MGFERGLSANTSIPPGNNSGGVNQLQNEIFKNTSGTQIGRVVDIILDGNYPNIEEYGGLNAIGTIFYQLNNELNATTKTAKPFFPQISSYPLVNELVLLFALPDTNIGNNLNQDSYYYINMVNLWNHPHHNAYPNPTDSTLPPSQQKDYQQTQAGSVRRVTDQSTEIEFNSPVNPSQDTFIERTNIHPLLPFAGDNIFQGRWGNSIRLGSTTISTTTSPLNNWSNSGETGDPLMLLRNGQPSTSTDKGWTPITENINNDLSSVYLTSTQQIPINLSSEKNFSYDTPPTQANQFIHPQIILNSDRLVLNAKTDGVLISSEKYIGLSSNNSVNIDAKEFHIDSSTVKLGSKNASESVILGDTFLLNLKHLITGIEYLCQALQGSTLWPEGVSIPDAVASTPASELLNRAQQFKSKIENFKSKTSKTI